MGQTQQRVRRGGRLGGSEGTGSVCQSLCCHLGDSLEGLTWRDITALGFPVKIIGLYIHLNWKSSG